MAMVKLIIADTGGVHSHIAESLLQFRTGEKLSNITVSRNKLKYIYQINFIKHYPFKIVPSCIHLQTKGLEI
jgi:hypothetical protein